MVNRVTIEQGRQLLTLARAGITAHLAGEPLPSLPRGSVFAQECGTFVTLKLDGQLRGCIGNIEPHGSLAESVLRNSISAAVHDTRFQPLSGDELDRVRIEVSILTLPEPLNYDDSEDLVSSLKPGIHGVILRLGQRHAATFLPQVWEQLPQPEQFLDQLCRKAGVNHSAWREEQPTIEVYEVEKFSEGEAE
ncbi:MAG: AmmeMemoRadiSam system protein A [Desulfobulbaceae bacterium]|uniref:AmmeMemoRadiSam system protein A n=1 Tax=Candidatus Desulfatifera sulfidica TaxID=2841691 RepID=A0A8J6T8R2_9BACT|nr:AmmeMemoRadiSam system protein A [Candidatus Desulfatifera sulfidica]